MPVLYLDTIIMQKSTLKYKDENDRSLGLAGSAIAIVVWNGEDHLSAISLDSEPGEGVEMSPEFGFAGNPRLSARLAWQLQLKQLELTGAMVAGNVMCRSYVGERRPLSSAARSLLRAVVRDEAVNRCSLEEDECDAIFDRIIGYQQQLFSHSAIVEMALGLADDLRRHRRMTSAEILDRLHRLPRL